MKTILASLCAACLLGCAYTPNQFALQPHEKVIFNDEARANEFRQRSMNDLHHTNRVVEITRPCAITTE